MYKNELNYWKIKINDCFIAKGRAKNIYVVEKKLKNGMLLVRKVKEKRGFVIPARNFLLAADIIKTTVNIN